MRAHAPALPPPPRKSEGRPRGGMIHAHLDIRDEVCRKPPPCVCRVMGAASESDRHPTSKHSRPGLPPVPTWCPPSKKTRICEKRFTVNALRFRALTCALPLSGSSEERPAALLALGGPAATKHHRAQLQKEKLLIFARLVVDLAQFVCGPWSLELRGWPVGGPNRAVHCPTLCVRRRGKVPRGGLRSHGRWPSFRQGELRRALVEGGSQMRLCMCESECGLESRGGHWQSCRWPRLRGARRRHGAQPVHEEGAVHRQHRAQEA